MVQVSDSQASTQALVDTSKVLRSLSPNPLISLHLVNEKEDVNQDQIASAVNCARSTVSKYLRTLNSLPVALVEKQGHQYVITDPGKHILELMKDAASKYTTDLDDDWSTESGMNYLDEFLTPLHDSRSATPFFVLYTLHTRIRDQDNSKERAGVTIGQIQEDIKPHLHARGDNITTQQLRQIIRRFSDAESIDFDGKNVQLTDKGFLQADLFIQVYQHIVEHTAQQPVDHSVSEEAVPQQDTNETRSHSSASIIKDGEIFSAIENKHKISGENVEELTHELRKVLQKTNISIYELEQAVSKLKQQLE
jgi:predicted transcriptional regulator